MTTPASSYLFQARTFVSGSRKWRLEVALATAKICESFERPYPESVRSMVHDAYDLLRLDAPEVAAEFGPPSL
ncbi:hypothetical protein [Rhodococcus sp. CH91]|uniref:hypothetical protein n=1 Tax=Rhodococcus sp. CH91 TaxID=2910256 RepID=UPI001F4B8194|nr:hypothetical protein [Rhodococcus sp. CH91]